MSASKRKALPAGHKVAAEIERVLNDYVCGERSFEGVLAGVDRLIYESGRHRQQLLALMKDKFGQLGIADDLQLAILERFAPERAGAAAAASGGGVPLSVDTTQGRADSDTDDDVPVVHSGGQLEQLPMPMSPSAMQIADDTGPELPRPGAVLNHRYELIRCVGAGGSSNVYKALDRRKLLFDDPYPYVAVKVLNQRYRSRPDWPEALRREAARCQQLNCPNIVKVFDVLRDGQTVYIVMEYLSGSPLTQTIRTEEFNGLPPDQAYDIISSMGRALAYAHAQGIVHCDFKPANIFLTQEGDIKLIDFGIARMLDEESAGSGQRGTDAQELFEQNAVTPAYASPELLERAEPDPRDDIYSLACTAYELLTGGHPYDYKPATVARDERLSVQRRSGLTRTEWKALSAALALHRADRTPTVEAFLDQFYGASRIHPGFLRAAALLVALSGVVWLYTKMAPPDVLEQLAGHPVLRDLTAADSGSEGVADSSPVASSKATTGTQQAERLVHPQDTANQVIVDTSPHPPNSGPVLASPETSVATSTSTNANQEGGADKGKLAGPDSSVATDTDASLSRAQSVQSSPENKASATSIVAAESENFINDLLQAADRQIAQKKLIAPTGDSAVESYQAVLAKDPDNTAAMAGLAMIQNKYFTAVRTDMKRGNLASARQNLRDGRSIPVAGGDAASLERELESVAAQEGAKARQQRSAGLAAKAERRNERNAVTPSEQNSAGPAKPSITTSNGLDAIAERLKARAVVKQRQGDLVESQALIAEGLRVQPQHEGLKRLRQAIEHQMQSEAAQHSIVAERTPSPSRSTPTQGASETPAPASARDANLNFGTF